MPLFITPPMTIDDPALDAQWQQLRERLLVEERVAAGEQEHVQIALPGEPGEHRRLVHAGADRPEDALARAAGEGPGRRRSMAACQWSSGSWMKRDVDALQADPLEALLDRPADPVGAVVEDRPDRPGRRVEGVVLAVERLPVDIGAGGDGIGRPDEPADLGRQDERVAVAPAEGRAHASLGQAVAVQRGRVEVADADVPGVGEGRRRLVVADRGEQAADGRAAESEPRDTQAGPAERHPFGGFKRHVGHRIVHGRVS